LLHGWHVDSSFADEAVISDVTAIMASNYFATSARTTMFLLSKQRPNKACGNFISTDAIETPTARRTNRSALDGSIHTPLIAWEILFIAFSGITL